MKIPEYEQQSVTQQWETGWEQMAAEVSMETGVYVKIGREFKMLPTTFLTSNGGSGVTTINAPYLSRIFFKVGDHEFEGLAELKRAIRLKTFL